MDRRARASRRARSARRHRVARAPRARGASALPSTRRRARRRCAPRRPGRTPGRSRSRRRRATRRRCGRRGRRAAHLARRRARARRAPTRSAHAGRARPRARRAASRSPVRPRAHSAPSRCPGRPPSASTSMPGVLADHPALAGAARHGRSAPCRARSRSTSRRSPSGQPSASSGSIVQPGSSSSSSRALCALREARTALSPPNGPRARRRCRRRPRRRTAPRISCSWTSRTTLRRSPSCVTSIETTRPRVPLDDLDHRRRAPAGGYLDEQPLGLRAEAAHDPEGDDAQRPEREQRDPGRDDGGDVVAGAARHADRGDEPQRRGRREAAHRESLPDDRARAEEADAADDLRRDARRVGAHEAAAVDEEVVEAVRRDEREERRADADDEMRAQPGLALAQLALEADRAAEPGGDREAQQLVRPGQRRDRGAKEVQPPPPRPAARRSRRCRLGEREQLVERRARERIALGGRLHLDQPAVAGHHDVHVGVGVRVLGVVEVEQRHAVDDADRHGRDGVGERLREAEAVERPAAGDVRAADRRAARAAVGLQHVAVEPASSARRARGSRRRRASRGRSAAGSRSCGPAASRAQPRAATRSPVDAGSSEYSAVIQPRPWLRSQRGTSSSTIAVQSTFVFPCVTSTEPCGCSR